MEATNASDPIQRLRAATKTPIADLTPDLPDTSSRAVHGIVTITWPYSSVKGSFAFILAEPDYRLRRSKGQVRINLTGSSAKAAGESGLSSGDVILLGLDGAEWEPQENKKRQSLPGAGIDWQLKFTEKLVLQVTLTETSETKLVTLDHPPPPVEPKLPVVEVPSTETNYIEDLIPESFVALTPASKSHVARFKDGEYESPAFVKRARTSYGSLFEDGYDIFEDDGGVIGKGRKRSRFGRESGAWKYSSQSLSPEPTVPTVPHDRSSSPARAEMTDEGCQTMELDFSMPSHQQTTSKPSNDQHTLKPPMEEQVVHQQGMVDHGVQGDFHDEWPTTIPAPPSSLDQNGTLPQVPPARAVGAFGNFGPSMQPVWNPRPAKLPSAGHSQTVEPSHGFTDNYEDERSAEIGFTGSNHHILSPSLSNHLIEDNEPPHSNRLQAEEQDYSMPSVPQSTAYPPLHLDNEEQIGSALQESHPDYPLSYLDDDKAPFSQALNIEGGPFGASIPPAAEVGSASWATVNNPSQVASISRTGRLNSVEGDSPENAVLLDESDSDGDPSPPTAVEETIIDGGAEALDMYGDVDVEDEEDEMEGEYAEDEPEYDPDEMGGDYDTRIYNGPDDDEDDSHDEDMRSPNLEPEFNGGESWDEDEGENLDYEEDGNSEGYESEYEMDDEEQPQQRPQPTVQPIPQVIDLISSSEDEGEDDTTDQPPPPPSRTIPNNTLQTQSTFTLRKTPPQVSEPVTQSEDVEQSDEGGEDAALNEDSDEETGGHYDTRNYIGPDDDEDDSHDEDMQSPKPELVFNDGESWDGDSEENLDYDEEEEEEEEEGDDEVEMQGKATSSNRARSESPASEDEDVEELFGNENDEAEYIIGDEEVVPVSNLNQTDGPEHQLDDKVDPGLKESPEASRVEVVIHENEDTVMEDGEVNAPQSAADGLEILCRAVDNESKANNEAVTTEEQDGVIITPVDTEGSSLARAQEPENQLEEHRSQDDDTVDLIPTLPSVPSNSQPVIVDNKQTTTIAPSSPPLTHSFISQLGDEEKVEVVIEETTTTTEYQIPADQLPTPRDTQITEDATILNPVATSLLEINEPAGIAIQETVTEQPTDAVESFVATETSVIESVATQRQQTPPNNFVELAQPQDVAVSPSMSFQTQDRAVSPAMSFQTQADADTITQASFTEPSSKFTIDIETKAKAQAEVEAEANSDIEVDPSGVSVSFMSQMEIDEELQASIVEYSQDFEEADSKMTGMDETSDHLEGDESEPDISGDEDDVEEIFSRGPSPELGNLPQDHPDTVEDVSVDTLELEQELETDPSVELARAANASKRNAKQQELSTKKTPAQRKSLPAREIPTPEVEDSSVQLARASLNKAEEDNSSMTAAKLMLVRHLRDELPSCTSLKVLRQHLQRKLDVMAVAMMQPPEPQRAKGGPREYMMSFTITDHSIGPYSVAEVQLYRPHKESLPIVKEGDIVLLRNFTVISLPNKGYGLRTNDESSWAVFDREDTDQPAQIKGPPVEYGDKERVYAMHMRAWFNLLDGKAREKLERANKKIVDAGGRSHK